MVKLSCHGERSIIVAYICICADGHPAVSGGPRAHKYVPPPGRGFIGDHQEAVLDAPGVQADAGGAVEGHSKKEVYLFLI